MGKIVKYCHSCDEGFAEKFGFCPNCGQSLSAFEMNPVTVEPPPIKKAAPVPTRSEILEPVKAPEPVRVAAPVPPPFLEMPEPAPKPEPVVAVAPPAPPPVAAPVIIPEPEPFAKVEPVKPEPIKTEPAKIKPARAAAAAAGSFVVANAMNADSRRPVPPLVRKDAGDGGFHVTVIEEKNGKQRNLLLVASLGFMIFLSFGALVYNIFSKDLDLGAIGDDEFLASVADDAPTPVDDVKQPKSDKSAGGGGGGGQHQDETTQGDLANQTKNPLRPPEAIPRLENPALTLPPASTQGNKQFEQTHDRYGDPNGRFTSWNNGSGSGGGQGTGTGNGQGSGRGTGAGSGTGSGYGGGLGDGNGNGRGSGDDGGAPPPPRAVGVTQAIKILNKPHPGYTDSARSNNVQGTVLLRVTFMANGSIGGISAVKGLPDGLTEQAIAAAHRITFEPAKLNGVGQTVTKTIEYTFSIY